MCVRATSSYTDCAPRDASRFLRSAWLNPYAALVVDSGERQRKSCCSTDRLESSDSPKHTENNSQAAERKTNQKGESNQARHMRSVSRTPLKPSRACAVSSSGVPIKTGNFHLGIPCLMPCRYDPHSPESCESPQDRTRNVVEISLTHAYIASVSYPKYRITGTLITQESSASV